MPSAAVTGAGIGRGVAMGLLERGWAVGLLGRRRAPLEEALADLPIEATVPGITVLATGMPYVGRG